MRDDVQLAMNGDRTAFGRLVQATAPLVSAISFAITRDRHIAEDAAQDTYLAVWHAIGQLKNPDSFLPWLRQVTRNVAYSALRLRTRRRSREIDEAAADTVLERLVDPAAPADQRLLAAEQERAVHNALDALPDLTRECVVLFYSEGRSAEQVAALLGLAPATVRKRLERARRILKREIAAAISEEVRRIRLSMVTSVIAGLGSYPRDVSALAVASASIASVPLAAAGGAIGGTALTWARVQALARRLPAQSARQFTRAALLGSFALGVTLPLWQPRLLWVWFLTYQALVAFATFCWLPSRGVPVTRTDVVRWLLFAGVGGIAVAWASANM